MTSQVLLHVGLHKTGSSWLERWLAEHPSIAYAHNTFGGIPRPIDICRTAMADQPRWYAISDEHLTGGRVWPEGYTYLLLRHAGFHQQPTGIPEHRQRVADQLYAMFPNATVLITTRGFAGALRSLYSQVVRMGGDQTFDQFLASYASFVADWLDLNAVIELYRARFGQGQVLILPFEILAEDEARYERLLEERLDLQPTPLAIGRVYPSLSPRQLVAYRRCSRIWLQPLAKRLPWRHGSTLYLAYAAWVVNRPWCDGLIQFLHAPGRYHPAPKVPTDVLERFRGKASLLATDPLYAPYRADYLN
jgi:hypothetical protein